MARCWYPECEREDETVGAGGGAPEDVHCPHCGCTNEQDAAWRRYLRGLAEAVKRCVGRG